MEKKKDPIVISFNSLNTETTSVSFNIENFLKNHVREGAVGRSQNMAARRDTWNPLAMKDQGLANQGSESHTA